MSSNEAPKKRRWPRILLLQLVALVVGVLVCELGWRLVLRSRGAPHDSAKATAEIERLHSSARDFVPRVAGAQGGLPNAADDAEGRFVHPFQAWENNGAATQIESEATRLDNPEFAGDVEVLTLGGSVADMFGHFGVPRLEERLRADPRFKGKRFYWYRYARGGYKQPQQLNAFTWLLGLGFTPEIVINLDGFNDVALAMDNAKRGTSPLYPSIPHWGSLAIGGIADRETLDQASRAREHQRNVERIAKTALHWNLPVSAIATTLVLRKLNTERAATLAAYEAYSTGMKKIAGDLILKGPPYGTDPEVIAEKAVQLWAECSRNLRAICEARGIHYLHVLQPTLHDTGSKTLTADEVQTGAAADTWIRGVQTGYPKLRKRGAELAAQGEHFVDATGVFRDVAATIYFDSCHFREDGNRILADAIADGLLATYPK